MSGLAASSRACWIASFFLAEWLVDDALPVFEGLYICLAAERSASCDSGTGLTSATLPRSTADFTLPRRDPDLDPLRIALCRSRSRSSNPK